ncbi:hypothetical protein WICPIJ_002714 [Wickerhamomyces pijperi]|uniref:Uncharacterized protein n=1 Tax=Wickerhamomyces pijperi TaxID=599730 RepID=A0A9P8QB87_WICPI|nr:hypothetical protein WICPIJ_002714 [Wickerhamomyces pijperi]
MPTAEPWLFNSSLTEVPSDESGSGAETTDSSDSMSALKTFGISSSFFISWSSATLDSTGSSSGVSSTSILYSSFSSSDESSSTSIFVFVSLSSNSSPSCSSSSTANLRGCRFFFGFFLINGASKPSIFLFLTGPNDLKLSKLKGLVSSMVGSEVIGFRSFGCDESKEVASLVC